MTNDVLIKVENVSKVYGSGDGATHALKDISLEIYDGEFVAIMGPSGSGKSTLFNMVGGLDKASSGKVTIGGANLGEMTQGQLAYFRGQHIGYVFQAYNLIPSLTALKNVALPAVLSGHSPEEAADKAMRVLDQVGLKGREDHRPDELSGGQQQRVAIARSLVNTPSIILADEPTANLDFATGEDIMHLMHSFCKEMGVTIVSATHDPKMLKITNRIVWIKDGAVDRIADTSTMNIEEGGIEH